MNFLLRTLVFFAFACASALVVGEGQPPESSPKLWSLEPMTVSVVPHTSRGTNAIDAFIAVRHKQEGRSLGAQASRRALIRRASYDLMGLPPNIAEVEAFVADPRSDAEAFRDVVEALLASKHYGEHWGRHWMDVVRYADTAGENTDHPLPHAWRYRNWVIDAFNEDMPYHEFVQQQLAGDILAKGKPADAAADSIVATGYLAIARRFGHDIDKRMHLTYEDTIDNLGKTFLGLTISCARCHDHKHDPIPTRDYYALYGVLESTRFSFPGCEPKQQPRDLVPLETGELMAQRRAWEQRREALRNERPAVAEERLAELSAELKDGASVCGKTISQGDVPDGEAVLVSREPIVADVRKGEVVQLSILPRGNYGADTTILDYVISYGSEDGSRRKWSVADLIDSLITGNPNNDTWCFMDTQSASDFLRERKDSIDGHPELKSWTNGGTPSVFVNTSHQPVQAWTSLPPRTFFVHPGPKGPVAIAWISPVNGKITIDLKVSDGHPGGDGVAWRLDHFASPEMGGRFLGLGNLHQQRLEHEAAVAEHAKLEPVIPVAYAVAEGTPKNAQLHRRGSEEDLGEEVPRTFLTVLGGGALGSPTTSGRLELARRITAPDNPLTARVMVNRIWGWHFGHGLVATPNDFGTHGVPPTHPELLDFLAQTFVAEDWSLKAMHRLIMASATYQQEASDDVSAAHYAGFRRRRITAEELRDTLLVASGKLDRTVGVAHPFPPESSWSFTQHNPFTDEYATNKRSVYLMRKRNRTSRFFALFNGADPNASTAMRDITTMPTQALYFMNDPFFHTCANGLARRIQENGTDRREQLDFACRALFARPTTDDEVAAFNDFASTLSGALAGSTKEKEKEIWDAYARILLGSNELLHID